LNATTHLYQSKLSQSFRIVEIIITRCVTITLDIVEFIAVF